MNSKRLILFLTLLAAALTARAGFVYETPLEFISAGDFNGDGVADALVVDKLTGNARVGYSDGHGGLTWSAPLVTGVENATGCGVGRFLQPPLDAVAVTSPTFNQVNLVDLSRTNAAGAPQTFAPIGLGPHSVVGLQAPQAPVSPGVPFLLVASSSNDTNSELLELSQWSGSSIGDGSFAETGPFDLPNALDLGNNVPTLATGMVRGATNDALHIWQFGATPGLVGLSSNLPSGSAYVFGQFTGQTNVSFIFYQPGGTNLALMPLLQTNSAYAFGNELDVALSEPAELVVFVAGSAVIQFGDGVQGLTLPGGSPALSAKYQFGAGAAGNVFTGIAPLINGQFVLLDAAAGASSSHAQVLNFNGTNFTVLSSSALSPISSSSTRVDVWLFQLEPFVNHTPGFVSSYSTPAWADSVSGLPGAIQVTAETDAGASNGLGNATLTNLGSAPASAAFGLGNQYNTAISVFAYGPPHAADPVQVTITPPPGSYGSPLTLQFSSSPGGSGVRYRVNTLDSWHDYTGPFTITNDSTIQYYGTNSGGQRASLQMGAYVLGVPLSPPATPPLIIDSSNTNKLPPVSTNEVVISRNGTLFYGRLSAAGAGTVWAINLDGSADTYITDGFLPHASHDGRWLAFLRNNNSEFWLHDLQSGAEHLLATAPAPVTDFEWEPDDSALLTDYGCAIGDLDTNGGFAALSSGDCSAGAPTRNPVDHRIADFDNSGILVADALVILSIPGASWPGWSPDGNNLAFRDGNLNLWLSDSSGGSLVQLSAFSDETNGALYGALWLPDGLEVVFAGAVYDTNGLWVLPIRSDRLGCDGAPYRLPTTPGDAIVFAGAIVSAPSTSGYTGSLPDLFIRQDRTNIVVYWSTNIQGFTLETQSNISSPSWTPITGPYYLNGPNVEYWKAKNDLPQMQYFRLHYTGPIILSPAP